MNLITLDFETYYDRVYGLGRLSMEEYVTDPRFEIIMVGIKINDKPAQWYSYKTIAEYLTLFNTIGLGGSAMLCHNTLFDGVILSVHFPSVMPAVLLDTMCMAQAVLKPYHRSISLDSCLKVTDCPIRKGTTVHNMVGRSLESLTPMELQEYGDYCITDCEGEHWLFKHLAPQIPKSELEIIDMTLRMYLEPMFDADPVTLEAVLLDTREKKRQLMNQVPPGITKTQLSSNPQFAKLLQSHGVDVPTKISLATDKMTYALAKNDTGWKDLEEVYGDDPIVGPLLAARLGVKSTLAESRSERLLEIAQKWGKLRIPLRYYAAHTGRYGGMEKINAQNFTRINPKDPSRVQLRYGVAAPPDYSVLACDLSQIEARLNAWLSGCEELLQVFRDKGDPYCAFATKIWSRPITKADQHERFIGKTCILGLGYGMGAPKLKATLRAQGVKEDIITIKNYVDTYRNAYYQIPALWRHCDDAIQTMASGGNIMIGPCMVDSNRILLPNDMFLTYPNLRWMHNPKYEGWSYDFAGMGRTMWGGKLVENIVQSLARIIITQHMREARKVLGIRPALQAHDELVYVVPNARLAECEAGLLSIMSTPPEWAKDVPIDCEAAHGPTYGDAK